MEFGDGEQSERQRHLFAKNAGKQKDNRPSKLQPIHTHTRLTALFRDYPGEPVPER